MKYNYTHSITCRIHIHFIDKRAIEWNENENQRRINDMSISVTDIGIIYNKKQVDGK